MFSRLVLLVVLVLIAAVTGGTSCGGRAPVGLVAPDGRVAGRALPDAGADGAGASDGSVPHDGGPDLGPVSVQACAPLAATPTGLGRPEWIAPCRTMCGDERIDSCTGYGGPDGGIPLTRTEACDGTNLAAATCASIGFAGGTLACDSCEFDTSACMACASCGRVSACASSVSLGGIRAIDLAITADRPVVAFADSQGIHLATVGDDLNLTTSGPTLGGPAVRSLALVSTPTGFLVAAGQDDGVTIYPLGSDGALVAPSRLIPNVALPVLAGRPGGGPLLAWSEDGGGERVALVGADGREETTPVTADSGVVGDDDGASAIFVGDGFLLATRELAAGVVVTSIGVDGKPGSRQVIRAETELPQLLWTGTSAWLSLFDFSASGGGVTLERLDRRGAPVGTAIPLLAPGYHAVRLMALGEDPVALHGVGDGLQLARFAPTGAAVVAPFGIYASPTGARSSRVVRRGDEAFVAWIGGSDSRLGLARVDLRP